MLHAAVAHQGGLYLICTYLLVVPITKADSKHQLPARACLVEAGGSIVV